MTDRQRRIALQALIEYEQKYYNDWVGKAYFNEPNNIDEDRLSAYVNEIKEVRKMFEKEQK